MIEFRQVSKTYPGSDDPVVKDLSFEVLEGEICVRSVFWWDPVAAARPRPCEWSTA
jgi:hypothetical protein